MPTLSTLCIITARVRSTREGNVLTSVCPSIHPSVCPQGGVPISHNALQHFPECHGAAGGYLTGYPPGGGPGTPRGGGGSWPGTPPPPRGVSGYPPGGVRVPPGGGPGTPPGGGYPGRTTEGVLTTRRAVCLLRSRRRTFLWENSIRS